MEASLNTKLAFFAQGFNQVKGLDYPETFAQLLA
jgi:hypothetical protein